MNSRHNKSDVRIRFSFLSTAIATFALLAMSPMEIAAQTPAASLGDSVQWSRSPEHIASNPSPTPTSTPQDDVQGSVGQDGFLPNAAGQTWHEYNIRPYTVRINSTNHPERALVSWIMQDTGGWETWHGDTLTILNANTDALQCYHAPEIQERVASIVDRFLNTSASSDQFELKIVSVDHPNWRSSLHQFLEPVRTQSPSIAAWIAPKESAAQVMATLQRRSDFRIHGQPQLLVRNGESGIVSSTRPVNYVRDVQPRTDNWAGYEQVTRTTDEGFALELVPLMSLDRTVIEAMIKLDIDQIEKMLPVVLETPSTASPNQRTQVEIPQTTQFRMYEKFRWPSDQVLVIDLGMVVLPNPGEAPSAMTFGGIPLPFTGWGDRANVLIFVEHRGQYSSGSAAPTP